MEKKSLVTFIKKPTAFVMYILCWKLLKFGDYIIGERLRKEDQASDDCFFKSTIRK